MGSKKERGRLDSGSLAVREINQVVRISYVEGLARVVRLAVRDFVYLWGFGLVALMLCKAAGGFGRSLTEGMAMPWMAGVVYTVPSFFVRLCAVLSGNLEFEVNDHGGLGNPDE